MLHRERKRASKLEHEQRINTVMRWIIEGSSSSLIITEIIRQNWCGSVRNAERILKFAREKWIMFEMKDISKERNLKVAQLEHTKRTLKQEYVGTPQGIMAQVAVEKEIIKLKGLAKPTEIDLTSQGEKITQPPAALDYSSMSEEDLEQLLKLHAKYAPKH